MTKQQNTWTQKIINIGMDKVTDPEVQSRIRIMNASMSIAMFICVVMLLLVSNQRDIIVLFGSGIIFLAFYFLFTAIGKPQIGWGIILVLPPSAIVLGTLEFPVALSALIFILFCQTLSFILFRQRKIFFSFLIYYMFLAIAGCVLMFSDIISVENYDTDLFKNILVLAFAVLLQIFAVTLLQKERRRSEKEMRDSEAKFRGFFENNPISIIIDDTKNNQFVEINKRASELFGYSKKELLEINKPKLTYPEDQNIPLIDYDKLLSGEQSHAIIEKRYLHKSGSIIWAKTYLALIKDENNNPRYNIVMIQYITKAKNEES